MIYSEWHEELTSTADVLCERVRAGAVPWVPHGTLVVAGRQSAGRGRGSAADKPFYSPPGGCYFSLLLREGVPEGLPFTPKTALAARRVLARYDCHTGIKWVNDLFLANQKVGGILVQRLPDCAVVSVGVNLYQTEEPPADIRHGMAYCFAGQNRSPSPKEFAQEMAAEIMAISAEQNDSVLLEEYRAASIVLGKEIAYEESGGRIVAKALDIAPNGGLMIRDRHGRERILISGSITLLS